MAAQYIKYNILRILEKNLDATIKFYTKICGMNYIQTKNPTATNLPYKWQDNILHIFTYEDLTNKNSYHKTGLCFLVDHQFDINSKNTGYWKIGLGLRDVDSAVNVFNQHGYNVGLGEQFMDVGFLTHLSDPNAYTVELLQHDFEEHFTQPAGEKGILNQPILKPPVIGQITIRCTNPKKTCQFYTETLGMKLLCTERPGKIMPFMLYFFAYTNEEPPNSDLNAVENREWLYRQPFCQIEVQHRMSLPKDFQYNTYGCGGVKLGHVGFSLVVSPTQLESIEKNVGGGAQMINDKLFVHDPDGYLIEISSDSD